MIDDAINQTLNLEDLIKINSSISDVSSRVHTIETDYVKSKDISTFVDIDDVSDFTYSKSHIDASFGAINLSDYVTNSSVSGNFPTNSSVSQNYVTNSSLTQNYYNKSHVDASFGAINLSDYVTNSSVSSNYPTNSSVSQNYVTNSSLTQNYYNKSHIDASIAAITPVFVVMSEADYELITPNPSTLYFLT